VRIAARPEAARGARGRASAARSQLIVLAGAQYDDLAPGVVEQPGDILGVETRASLGRGRDHDPVVSLVGDRLTEGVPAISAALDA
jgi:hypothetical protein